MTLVNKSLSHYGSGQFLNILIENIFFQMLSGKIENLSQHLLSIEKFEIQDSMLNQ